MAPLIVGRLFKARQCCLDEAYAYQLQQATTEEELLSPETDINASTCASFRKTEATNILTEDRFGWGRSTFSGT